MIGKGVGKRAFKMHLEMFFDPVFYALVSCNNNNKSNTNIFLNIYVSSCDTYIIYYIAILICSINFDGFLNELLSGLYCIFYITDE